MADHPSRGEPVLTGEAGVSAAFRQNAVSKAVWKWTAPRAPRAEPGKPRRGRAAIHALVSFAVASVLVFAVRTPHARAMGVVVYAIGGVALVSGLFVPPVFRAIDRFGAWLGRALGGALTWILLMPFFYLCFVPARLVLRLRGRDPMNRRFLAGAPTYWTPYRSHRGPAFYRKQY